MIHQIEEIWRQTRDLPPDKRIIVNSLFSEIEHLHEDRSIDQAPPGQLEFFHQSKYYEPKWFSSTNGQIQ